MKCLTRGDEAFFVSVLHSHCTACFLPFISVFYHQNKLYRHCSYCRKEINELRLHPEKNISIYLDNVILNYL